MPLPTLGTALIEVLDALNSIVGPGVLDLTPNQATIHCVVYAGGKVGADGAVAEAAGYPLALAQQYPIRQLTTREISNSGGLYEHGDIIIEYIPPAYSDSVTGRSGGYTVLQLSPRATTNGTDVYYEVTGTHAGFYKVVELRTDERLTWSVVLTRTATRPMVTTPALSVTITSLAPNVGSGAGGTIVTVTGTGFASATSVLFGGVSVASFTVTSDTLMTCVTAPSANGLNLPVTVTAGSGTFATKSAAFTVIPAGYALFLHADAGVTAISGGVSSWLDGSGNGNNATQGNAGRRPTLGTAINGKVTLHFNQALSQSLIFASFTAGLTAMESFMLAVNTDDVVSSSPFCFTGSGLSEFLPFSDRKIYDATGSTSRYSTNFAPPSGAWSTPWLYNVVSTSSEWTMQFNGVQQFTSGVNVFGYATRSVGSDPGGAAYMSGDIRILLVYPSKLSVSDHAFVTSYLKAEGGIP